VGVKVVNLGKVYSFSDWNLETQSNDWLVHIYENDVATTITEEYTVASKYNTNFGITADIPLKIAKLGIKFGSTNESTNMYKAVYTRSTQSNFLGDTRIKFYDALVEPRNHGLMPYTYSTGRTQFTFLPLSR
jgi:hypothetical protein